MTAEQEMLIVRDKQNNAKRKRTTAKLKLIQITDKTSQKTTGGPGGRVLQAMALWFLLSSLLLFKMFKGKRMTTATWCL